MVREPLLDCGDHRVDPVDALARCQRVEVGAVVGERLGDEPSAPLRVGLVPALDVAVDQARDVCHLCLLGVDVRGPRCHREVALSITSEVGAAAPCRR
jgi:hypothetical protein